MRKTLFSLSIVLTLGLIMMACNLPILSVATQDTGQVATAVAQTVAALNLQTQVPPTLTPQIPTLGPTPTQTVQSLPTLTPFPTATPLPCNWAKLVSETYVDGTWLNINTNFNKSWRVKNAGTCTWNSNYKIKFFGGDAMNGPASKNFSGNVAPGETIDLILPLKAPGTAGTYKGYWHLYGDDNVDFTTTYGLWVTINSVNPAAAFAVTSAYTTVDNAGPVTCTSGSPHTFTFTANVTTNGAGTVTYHWVRDDSSNAGTGTLTYGAAGTQTVSTSWTQSGPGVSSWMQLYIDNPNHQAFNQVAISCSP